MPAGARRTTRREVTYGEQGLRLLPVTRFKDATARYWRVNGITVTGVNLEISELQFFDSSTQVTGTLASSSAPTLALTNLSDGSLSTRCYWAAATANNAAFWISIDLGSAKLVTGVKQGGFDTNNRHMSAFTLQKSKDNSSWTTVGSVSGLAYPGNNTLSALIPFDS
jgi:hypothetical protein